jgi:hypothetical protein
MSLWKRLHYLARFKRDSRSRFFELDESLSSALESLASQEHRPEEEIQADLIAAGLAQHNSNKQLQ